MAGHRNGMLGRPTGRDIVHRWEGNPLIDISDLSFKCSDILNAGVVEFDGRVLLLPFFLLDVIHYRYRLRVLRKNLLFTRQLAFEAARNITNGQEQGWQIRRIEIKTQDTLDKNKKDHYTEKIRRKQLNEIELLITHYLELINTGKSRYPEMIKGVYPSKGNYLTFLSNIRK